MRKQTKGTLQIRENESGSHPAKASPSANVKRGTATNGFTRREYEVCRWVAEGKTNGEIACILGISPRTAEKHVQGVLRKLGVENRASAAMELMNGFGEPHPR